MTHNNNQSMRTVVETFLIEETVDLIHDGEALQRWNDRVEELQLAGQKKIVKEEKSPIPFMWMNEALIATFETLCPTKKKVEEYEKTPIPVEILDLIALCKKEDYFYRIDVWFNEKDPDPVVVGYKYVKGKDNWEKEYYAEKYLIGRWADVKASLDTLINRAKKIFFKNETIRISQSIKNSQRELEDLETSINNKFGAAMPTTDMPF